MELPNRQLLRPDEIARYYSVSKSAVYRWIETGKLEAIKVAGKTIRIPRESAIALKKDIFE